MRKQLLAIVMLSIAFIGEPAQAEEIELKDGTVLQGHIVGWVNNNLIDFLVEDEIRRISFSEVKSIRFDPVHRPSGSDEQKQKE